MKLQWIVSALEWFRIQNASPGTFLHSIADMVKAVRVSGSFSSTSSISIVALIGLSWFGNAIAANRDSIAYLVAPTIAWAILLLSSSILLAVQARRQQAPGLLSDGEIGNDQWLTREQACIAVCFLFAQICEVDGVDSVGSIWSYTLLPSVVLLLKIWHPLANEQRKNSPAIVLTIIATAILLSFHCAAALFGHSSSQFLLPVSKSISLSVGLLLCEKLGREKSEVNKDFVELPQSYSLSSLAPVCFLTRLRNVSLASTAMLVAILLSQFVRSSVNASSPEIWTTELSLAFLRSGWWFVICWMIWEQKRSALTIGLLLSGVSTFELISQNKSQYVPVGELLLAFVVHALNSFDLRSIFDLLPIQRRQIYIIFALICFICILTSITFIPQQYEVHETPSQGSSIHPIEHLIETSQARFSDILSRQSQSLEEAVQVYKDRTGRHPPPKFDIWYHFAKQRNVVLIDEFDTITDLLKPFWGLDPSVVRRYAREAIGAEKSPYTGFLIRKGTITRFMYGGWFADDLAMMLGNFVEHLPDMDLALHYRDEPSVIIPHDLLAELVEQPVKMAENPVGNFSETPEDLVDGISSHYGTPVVYIGKETIWSQLIQSCPLDSPVRRLTNNTDLRSSYAYDPMGFIYNKTASTEVCNRPSLPHLHGFFDRPDTMYYCSTLLPIFSVSKVSSFNDILFPSPFHYSEVISVEESKDPNWDQKKGQLHWRGTTTTGFAALNGWKNHHRHRLVSAFDKIDTPVPILRKQDDIWIKDTISPDLVRPFFDVKFTSISGSSTEEARQAQENEFDIQEREDQQALWMYKYLLDVDGHGLSGRFYALLKSNSLVFKMSMFREWHDDWLFPWVHYIPLSLEGEEWFEIVRYFEQDGKEAAERIAGESRDWARRVLRKEDMEVWMFRLLLEYARVIDDARDSLGFEM